MHALVVAGLGEVATWSSLDGVEAFDASVMRASRDEAFRLCSAFHTVVTTKPDDALELFLGSVNPQEVAQALNGRTATQWLADVVGESLDNGARAIAADYQALGMPWGVDLSTVRRRFTIFHGSNDTSVPFSHSVGLHERVIGSELVTLDGAGHFLSAAEFALVLDRV